MGFVEQRAYTEFAFQRLDAKIDGVETRLAARIDGVETRIDGSRRRLDRVEARIDRVEARLDRVEARIDRVEARIDAGQEDRPDRESAQRDEDRLARLERKLDQFIDVQMETNRLTDLRLRALERLGRRADLGTGRIHRPSARNREAATS